MLSLNQVEWRGLPVFTASAEVEEEEGGGGRGWSGGLPVAEATGLNGLQTTPLSSAHIPLATTGMSPRSLC